MHRNELRLLKLVNTLLDFSRIEAGRVQARFEPTDLAALTADLASAFRSATERAGLRLIVDCPPLPAAGLRRPRDVGEDRPEPAVERLQVHLRRDRLPWTLEPDDGHVELRVRDTGIGIAASDLDRVFDRFHRIERAAARTHEGSGIGLALVRELVTIHGGTIRAVERRRRRHRLLGSLPLGTAHLAAEHIAPVRTPATGAPAPRGLGATPYVEEALRWLPSDPSGDARRAAAPWRTRRPPASWLPTTTRTCATT